MQIIQMDIPRDSEISAMPNGGIDDKSEWVEVTIAGIKLLLYPTEAFKLHVETQKALDKLIRSQTGRSQPKTQ